MKRDLVSAAVLFALLTIVTGLVYPGLVTVVAQRAFPAQANGSLIERDGRPVGSVLIGQPFSERKYFWSRPSSTGAAPYDGLASGGSNLAPTSPALVEAVAARIAALRAADPHSAVPVPADLVTASASGLDPHISPAAADYQIDRVARARGLDPAALRALVQAHIEGRQFGLLGEPRVNVLALNLGLDAIDRR